MFLISCLGKKALTDLDIPLSRDNLTGLVCNLASNAIRKFWKKKKKIFFKIAVRAGKGFTSFISCEGMNDIFKIIKSFDDILIDRVTEAVKYEIEK